MGQFFLMRLYLLLHMSKIPTRRQQHAYFDMVLAPSLAFCKNVCRRVVVYFSRLFFKMLTYALFIILLLIAVTKKSCAEENHPRKIVASGGRFSTNVFPAGFLKYLFKVNLGSSTCHF